MFKDYYQILGVERQASQEKIKIAYRMLAKQYHPDVNEADPQKEEFFKEINEAYGVLGDSGQKRRYDIMCFPFWADGLVAPDGPGDAMIYFLRAILEAHRGKSGMGCGFGRRGYRKKF